MPNFDINSRFNKEANFSQVLFGEDGYVLETELNEMQHIQEEARAQIVRESIPSGVLNYFEPSFLPTTPNTFRLGQEMKVNVNGHIITIPKDTDIVLNEPPTEDFQSVTGKVGYREDLVFLEVWKEEIDYTETVNKFGGEGQPNVPNNIKDSRIGVETTRRIQTKWRIRVVDDVDFNIYSEDGFRTGNEYIQKIEYNLKVTSQGGNNSPLSIPNDLHNHYVARYCFVNNTTRTGKYDNVATKSGINDVGLYISGQGDDTSRELLKTVDGYVYAIPLFRVKRRNSGAYSVNNGNGSRKFIKLPQVHFNGVQSPVTTTVTPEIYELLQDGMTIIDYQYYGAQAILKLNGNNSITLNPKGGYSGFTGIIICDRPELVINPETNNKGRALFCDIIEPKRDIIDLRHKVSLTGFNYQELLEENFDKLLRGELNTKVGKKLLKTYHGIRKTPIDSNTVFYASFDGTDVAEVSDYSKSDFNLNTFKQMPTGLGVYKPLNGIIESNSLSESTGETTVECWIDGEKFNSNISASGNLCVLAIKTEASVSNYASSIWFNKSPHSRYGFVLYYGEPNGQAVFSLPKNMRNLPYYHVRLTANITTRKCCVYINGILLYKANIAKEITKVFNSGYFGLRTNGYSFGDSYISDFMVSNIDRGENFSTLPKDFIDGYAVISSAFNEQRAIFGDPLTSQVTTDVVKASGSNDRHITVEQATKGTWASGDKIKVKGLCGEVITGLIDGDTALARILRFADGVKQINALATNVEIYLDSVSKISVGDTLKTSRYIDYFTVTSIDNTLNKIVCSVSNLDKGAVLYVDFMMKSPYLYETTTSSSSPLVKFMKDSTLTNVVGTWTGLGTKEVTFTFGENTGLTNQNIQVEYLLNMLAGQGGISEVLTQTLGGEYKGQKLIANKYLTITDDFRGKVDGSYSECPHFAGYDYNTKVLITDFSSFTECTNNTTCRYSKFSRIEANSYAFLTQKRVGDISQMYFKFDLIRIIEDKLGAIPSIDKVAWLKSNIKSITVTPKCRGVGPSGNLVKFTIYRHSDRAWNHAIYHNDQDFLKELPILLDVSSTNGVLANVSNFIGSDGCVNALLYAEASDGITESTVYLEYINIEVTLKVESGFDVVAPENNRRDAGLSGALLVRKETKEIRRYPLGKADENTGIVTYGDYVPYQGNGSKLLDLESQVVLTKSLCIATNISSCDVIDNDLSTDYSCIINRLPLAKMDFEITQQEKFTLNGHSDYFHILSNRGLNAYGRAFALGESCEKLMYNKDSSLFRGYSSNAGWSFSLAIDELNSNEFKNANAIVVQALLLKINDGDLMLGIATHKNYIRASQNLKYLALDLFDIYGLPLIKEGN